MASISYTRAEQQLWTWNTSSLNGTDETIRLSHPGDVWAVRLWILLAGRAAPDGPVGVFVRVAEPAPVAITQEDPSFADTELLLVEDEGRERVRAVLDVPVMFTEQLELRLFSPVGAPVTYDVTLAAQTIG